MISRDDAINFLNEKIENKNIIKHMLATEVCMRALAQKLEIVNCLPAMLPIAMQAGKLKIDQNEWAMAGLLHDGDYCEGVPAEKQGIQVGEWLREKSFEIPDNVAHAMAAHNWSNTKVEPQSPMDWALFCGDSLTGLIVAATLVLPSRKLADVTVENVLNRFKEKSFAKGTRREDIALCEEKLGLHLNEFVDICLKAMQGISNELGL